MYLTMNRFKVNAGQEAAFETIWTGRESHLPKVPGFVSFHLFKGPEADGIRLYASHTMWESEAAFRDWTKSEAFAKGHSKRHPGMFAGHPVLEQYEVFESTFKA